MSSEPMLPIVAIVGRPNVGKSRLFNRYAGHRRALVQDMPGVTRDRIAEEIAISGRRILLVDTAGLDPDSEKGLDTEVQIQARTAVTQADAIIFVVDAQAGLLPEDQAIARTLRRTDKPLALAVNKIDIPEHMDRMADFYTLGFDSIHPISAEHGGGAFEVLEEIVEALPNAPLDDGEAGRDSLLDLDFEEIPDYSDEPLDGDFGGDEQAERKLEPDPGEEEPAPVIRVAVVGRPNVGKSSLVNKLLGEERVVVSDVPGTTRDSIDIHLDVDGTRLILVDTAGLRRPGRRDEKVERASALMTVRALERADVALLLIDASEGIGDQDAHIANLVQDRGCAMVVLANKWDQVHGEDGKEILDKVDHALRFVSNAPILSISAMTGAKLNRLYPAISKVFASGRHQISTSKLNRWLQEAVRRHEPALGRKSKHVRRPLRFFYAAQIGVRPPKFVFFCTDPSSIQTAYKRYLENRLREEFGFDGTPIRMRFRARKR